MPTHTWWLVPWNHPANAPSITVEVDPANVTGLRGAFGPALHIRLAITPSLATDPELRLHSLEGWIAWPSDSIAINGVRIPSQVVMPNAERLVVPITHDQIAEIERRRSGEIMNFRIYLAGMATIPNPDHTSSQYVRQRDGQMKAGPSAFPEVTAVRSSNGDGGELVAIPREQWLNILRDLGAGTRRLIELPEANLPVGQAQWTACMRLLEEATDLFRRQQYPQVVTNCRTIIEGVTQVLCADYGMARDPNKPGTPFHVWSKGLPEALTPLWTSDPKAGALLYALLQASWSWTSKSHHFGSPIPQREEVAFALSLATDLLVFGAQALTAHPIEGHSDS